MQNVVLIGLLVDILNRHLRVEELIELHVALPVMLDSTFPQISLTTKGICDKMLLNQLWIDLSGNLQYPGGRKHDRKNLQNNP